MSQPDRTPPLLTDQPDVGPRPVMPISERLFVRRVVAEDLIGVTGSGKTVRLTVNGLRAFDLGRDGALALAQGLAAAALHGDSRSGDGTLRVEFAALFDQARKTPAGQVETAKRFTPEGRS